MGAAVENLQLELLRAHTLPDRLYLRPGTFDAATANALWLACTSRLVSADSAVVLAARAEVCGPLAEGSGQPVPGASVLIDGVWVPVPADVPLWVVPYRLGQLKDAPRGANEPIVQVILHHDAGDSAANTWRVLQSRGLSSHGSTDDNGVCYQFADLVRRKTWHAMGHRLVRGQRVAASFNHQSVGWDISNPVIQDSAMAAHDPDRPLQTVEIHGRTMTRLDSYPCQEEAVLALLRVSRKAISTIGSNYRTTCDWRGDLTGATPGIWGHLHVSAEKIDPFGFPFERLAEV